jgi:hypothetical protein
VNDSKDKDNDIRIHVVGVGPEGALVRSAISTYTTPRAVDVTDLICAERGTWNESGTLEVDGREGRVTWSSSGVERVERCGDPLCSGWHWQGLAHKGYAEVRVRNEWERIEREKARIKEWTDLPLIVLAGLR